MVGVPLFQGTRLSCLHKSDRPLPLLASQQSLGKITSGIERGIVRTPVIYVVKVDNVNASFHDESMESCGG